MKKIIIYSILCLSVILISCKKNYNCICSTPYIDSGGFTIHDTKNKAKAKCKDAETINKATNPDYVCTIN